MVRSTYVLEIVGHTGCCLTNVVIKAPLNINDPPSTRVLPPLTAPPGWNPQVGEPLGLGGFGLVMGKNNAVHGCIECPVPVSVQAQGLACDHSEVGLYCLEFQLVALRVNLHKHSMSGG